MRSSTYIALFAGSTAAQSSVTLFNLFQSESTLTQIGADATATTYRNECPSDNAGISGVPAELRPTPDNASATITPRPSAPATTPRARLARQASAKSTASGDEPDYSFCEPFTLKQGPSTWGFYFKDPTPNAWTFDMSCKWQGVITAADLTCTITQSGYVPASSALGVSTSVLLQKELQTIEAFQTVGVVSASGAPSAAVSQTPSGLHSGSPVASRSGSHSGSAVASSSATASAGAATSTGFAPARPLPTGVVIIVGGAAGVFAAALAL